MEHKNLLASVVVFGELYNSEKYNGISSIIAEFIKGAVVFEKKYSLSSLEVTKLLNRVYDFNILESVVRIVLHTNLKNVVEVKKNVFYFDNSIESEYIGFNQEIEEKNLIQTTIFNNLVQFVSEKEKKNISESEKSELFHDFNHFLFDNGTFEKYSNHISAFIIQNESDPNFISCLNKIREGLILYQGIKYTADINDSGKWDTDLVIYLNTEYLFNALGFNGLLFKEIFDDFYKLVSEVNLASIKRGKGEKIKLRYFPETQEEINGFFVSAESIKRGYKHLEPWRIAMKTIVEKCKEPSDVESERIKFFLELGKKEILTDDTDFEVIEHMEYNVEDIGVIEELSKESRERKKEFDENSCNYFFNIFTKINYYRSGNSKRPFEKIGFIFITESGLAKYLGHNNLVKFHDNDTSFAKDIDFVTSQIWFKLKKGFSDNNSLPKSFDVLTKSRIVLSSHLNNTLSKEYQKLIKESENGTLSKDEALARSYSLREKPNKPENITLKNIQSTFDFLNDDEYFEKVFRDKERKEELLIETQKKVEELQAEIQRRDGVEKEKEEQKLHEIFDRNRGLFVQKEFKKLIKNNWKLSRRFLYLFLYNLLLVVFATIFAANRELKDWICEFGFFQIFIIILYALTIVIEGFGSKYIFNRAKINDGWLWLLIVVRKNSYKEYRRNAISGFSEKYKEK